MYTGFAQGISITEIMYHPLDEGEIDDQELEFLEIRNITEASIDLSVATFTDGIEFTFGPNSILEAGAYWVLVSDVEAFAVRYPNVTIKGQYVGQLNNGGENLELRDRNGVLLEAVTYTDVSPWPIAADGGGKSIVKRDESAIPGSPDDASAWRASFNIHGSPGQEDPPPLPSEILVNEVLPHTDLPQLDSIELFNPTEETADIGGWYLSDDLSQPEKYKIPAGTLIPAGGYLVYTENEFAAESQGDASFRFNSHGDSAWLISANPDGALSGYSHGFDFGASANGVSFCRYLDSQGVELFVAAEEVTFGSENAPPLIGPMVINELLYKQGESGTEFIEIINVDSEAVPLFDTENSGNTWKINGLAYDFPTGVTVQPNQVVLVTNVEPEVFEAEFGALNGILLFGPFTGSIDNSGERITIRRPDSPDLVDGEIFVPYIDVDSVRYGIKQPWPVPDAGSSIEKISRNLLGLEPNNWQVSLSTEASPGMAQDLDFSTWQRMHFNNQEINSSDLVDPAKDFDGDGILNIFEYAFGLDPRILQLESGPRSLVVQESGNQYRAISFTQLIYGEDLVYKVQESGDLFNWNDATNLIQFWRTNNGDGTELIVLRAPDPLLPPDEWFQRLKILLSETE
ncbi:MAG: lamin tail domain-containing protein [Verrucomicrobia bacterium]|nr:lamin tail domain-containing protein [Verrucomicrobiota bacterium]